MDKQLYEQAKVNVIDRLLYEIWDLPTDLDNLKNLLLEELYYEYENLGGSESWWDQNYENLILENLNYLAENLYKARLMFCLGGDSPWN
jgi:hypothetical protein